MSDDHQMMPIPDSVIVSALGVASDSSNKLKELVNLMENILKKNIDSRNSSDQAVINKFITNSDTLTQIAEVTSIDAVKNMLKFSHIHEIPKNRILYKNGQDIDRVIIMLSGKFGIVKTGNNEIPKLQAHTSDEDKLRTILETSPNIIKELKRKKFYINFDIREYSEFKTTKALMFELEIKEVLEKEGIFDLKSLVSGKKYEKMLVSLGPCKVLSISSKIFYEAFQSFLKKQKADKIRVFRKFQCFSLIQDEKLLKIVEQLSLSKKKKGDFVYKEGDNFECIYLLFSGSIKITKTIALFKQDPNNLYLDRKKLNNGKAKILPYANLSSVYNYKPREKVVELGVVSQFGLFGEQEFFSQTERQVNAHIGSQDATFYEISLKKLQGWLPQKKGFITEFTNIIYKNRTEKKILYRQQKLSEIMLLENQNNMDYFFIDDEKKIEASVSRFKINKVNSVISPQKIKKQPVSIHPAYYNGFNFPNLEKKKNKSKSMKSHHHSHLTQQQTKITQLIHNFSLGPSSPKPKSKKKSQGKRFSIDIHNPLFEAGYFQKNRKQALRIEKQSRMKSVNTSRRSSRPRTSQLTSRERGSNIQL